MNPPASPFYRLLALALVAAWGTSPGRVQAIPNQIIGGGFVGAAGMPFEDFAAGAAAWDMDAPLPGKWEALAGVPAGGDSARLALSAAVFGVAAEQVAVHREKGRATRFEVLFRPARGLSVERLEASLRANLSAWAESGDADSGYRSGAARVSLEVRVAEGEILARFSPAVP